MGSTPRIRTMDALGLLVLRHHETGCRTARAATKASPVRRRLFPYPVWGDASSSRSSGKPSRTVR